MAPRPSDEWRVLEYPSCRQYGVIARGYFGRLHPLLRSLVVGWRRNLELRANTRLDKIMGVIPLISACARFSAPDISPDHSVESVT
jgi:hypothetical protein